MQASFYTRQLQRVLVALLAVVCGALQAAGEEAPVLSAVVVVGGNTLEDAARINAAIAGSPEGAEVVIRGTCLLNAPVRLLSNRSYRGESRTGTVLKQADGANLVALMASSTFLDNKAWTGQPVSVRHLRLDGNKKNNTESATAGLALRSWLSTVEDVHITNMGGDGLWLTNRSADGTGLETTQVNGRIAENFIERSGGHGIHIEDSQNAVTDWIVCDNWIAGAEGDGIHLDNAAGWFVERNHVYCVSQNAIYAHRIFATSISNNYIEGFGEGDEPGTWYGIYATVQGGAGSTIAQNRIFNLRGEKPEGYTYRYVALGVNYGTGLVVVANNVIRGKGSPEGTGLHYTATGNRELIVTSTGNLVYGTGTKRFVDGNVTLDPGL